MTRTSQEEVMPEKMVNGERTRTASGEEVVISGMSGIFPSSDSTEQFSENLYNQVNMVTEDNPRWIFKHPEVTDHLGKVQGMGKFDAQFFRVHFKQARTMEPMSRKLLEHAYSAIFDAGYNPLQLRGKKIGVFIGSSFSESEKVLLFQNIQRNGFGVSGCNKSMYANRISYWLDGKGPSYTLDLACASSMACLDHAYRSISKGECDAAIVGGCNLCMQPCMALNMRRAGFLSLDGKTRCFDKNGDGYARADAVSVLFLQKAKDARRIYSEVYHTKHNHSLMEDGVFKPTRRSKDIEDFLNAFYSEIDVSPSQVEFVEANGSAIPEADGNELEAIGNVFGKNKPIKVGSVKSNMGHSEPASGVCMLTKVCLAYQKGEIPANLNYETPQDHIPSFRDGKVQVVTENTGFNRGFTALNCFSYSGANVHVLLKGHYKKKELEKYKTDIPYLVLASGRQDTCVNMILDALKTKPVDAEQIRLLQSIHEVEIPGHMCRGYTVIETGEDNLTVCHASNADYFSGTVPPVWFVYSGMGSQWAGMGADLMRIPTFAAAIHKCHKILEPKGIDLIHIFTEPDPKIFDNIQNSFVGIAAVQIGLTDTLKELGIVPDNIIGHSVGELGCAYADGCFTAEEMILAAYSRGLVSVQTPFIKGSMAAVGLGFKAIQAMVPPEIEIACHNSSDSSTISGPDEIMKTFVADLTSRGIFAKEVPCSNIAYHSRYISEAGPGLLKYLTEVIQNPKERSKKWVSTSVPQDKWDEPEAKYSSAEYHTNNLLNSVLFEETSKLIPAGALVIEVAPHGLLQAILKRSHAGCSHVPLTRRAHPNPVHFFLESIGKLYQQGLVPLVQNLFPQVEFPVSTGTPMMSQLVGWEHSEDWPQSRYNMERRVTSAVQEFVMSTHDDDHKYLQGHVRDGNMVIPESALLVLVWETMAMHRDLNYSDMSVVFCDVKFLGEATLKMEEPFRLSIMIDKGDNKFEVSHDEIPIATGFVIPVQQSDIVMRTLNQSENSTVTIPLTADDVYRILHLKGYSYRGLFKSIDSTNNSFNQAQIKWTDNWVAFIDSLIQLNALARNYDGVSVPKFLKKLTIDAEQHKKERDVLDKEQPLLEAQLYDIFGISRCAGVEIDGIKFLDRPKSDEEPDILATGSFVPHYLTGEVDMETAVLLNLQVLAENITESEIKITEVVSGPAPLLAEVIERVSLKMPVANFKVNTVRGSTVYFNQMEEISKSNLLIVDNLLVDEKKMNNLHRVMQKNTFVLTIESSESQVNPKYKLFNVITALSVQGNIVILLNKAYVDQDNNVSFIPISQDNKFTWVSKVQYELTKTRRVVLVSEKQLSSGLLGLARQLSKEHSNKVGVVVIDDYKAPAFNTKSALYKDQMQKNLSINVLKNGKWGGFYYLSSSKSIKLHNAQLVSQVAGDIDKLSWVESSLPLSATKDTVQVHYAGPSFKDARKAAGKVKGSNNFGMDFSGINTKGQRVMGLLPGGTIASTVEADPVFTWPVPEHWSLEDAATVPLPYVHALYILTRHNMRKGTSVFVTGGAGALGQAVISICLALGSPVYTCVSDKQKKKFLLRLFPELDENHISCSREENFYESLLVSTGGKGCMFVINSLSGDFRAASMKCAAINAMFYDISDFDMKENNDFGMHFLMGVRSYVAMNLENVFKPENIENRRTIQKLVAEGIASGWVKPISRTTYTPSEVTRAFRLLSASKHRGRVLIKFVDTVNTNQRLVVKPRVSFSSENTYVVFCGDNQLGIELIDRLIKKGARKLVVSMKQESMDGYFDVKLLAWKKLDVTLNITSDDLKTEKGCVNILKEGSKLGVIEGIFVVQNSKHEEIALREEELSALYKNTTLVVSNLDQMSRQICNDLRQFVVLSCSSGTAPEEYVSAANQKICQARNEMGLPALIYHVKMLDEYNTDFQNVKESVRPQKIDEVFNALEISLKLNHSDVTSFNVNHQLSTNFTRHISKILGVSSIDDISNDLRLEELRINEIVIEELRTFLREVTGENYSSDGVTKMTIESLRNQDLIKKRYKNTKFDSGLGAFYTFIDEDECEATEPMVAMPTKLSNATEKEEELDPKESYLMLIPGFEGHSAKFVPLCERLKLHALTFQLGPDMTNESIPQMAVDIMAVTARMWNKLPVHIPTAPTKNTVTDKSKMFRKNKKPFFLIIISYNNPIVMVLLSDGSVIKTDVFPCLPGTHAPLPSELNCLPGTHAPLPAEPFDVQDGLLDIKWESRLTPFLFMIRCFKCSPLHKFIKKRCELKSKFYILGYSFGVNVALELAALMEKEGHVGVVYCLDSSPDALRVQLDAYIGDKSDGELQNIIIEHMYTLMTGEDCKDIKQEWEKLENWNAKVEACLLRLRVFVHYSNQYKESVMKSAYRRIQLARSYRPNLNLESEIVLMKGIPHPKAKPLPNDYNLSQYSKQPVRVCNLETDHAVAPQDCRVSNIVNSSLEPKILEKFKKKSLCETYLANLYKMW